jgi:hypothetical protein
MKREIFSENILFKGAARGTERAVYKKLIAPFENDLPATPLEGLRRVCAFKKYAYIGGSTLSTDTAGTLPCYLVPLPGTSYRDPWAFITTKNSPYKRIINWR